MIPTFTNVLTACVLSYLAGVGSAVAWRWRGRALLRRQGAEIRRLRALLEDADAEQRRLRMARDEADAQLVGQFAEARRMTLMLADHAAKGMRK
jgi:hypothetical protein